MGGIYGVAVGGLFAGRSMFHRAAVASKIAVVHLHEHLLERRFGLFGIQRVTDTTEAMGAAEVPRIESPRRACGAGGARLPVLTGYGPGRFLGA